jgi:uncharacterized protein YjbI with pentapeptide repeats
LKENNELFAARQVEAAERLSDPAPGIKNGEQQPASARADESGSRHGDTPMEGQSGLERLNRAELERALAQGASLHHKDLSGLDLSNLRFEGVNLAGSNLSNTRNVNTTYKDSRLDGVNFSDATFRNSAMERVFAINSRWDRAQFDETSIVFSNFGNASFRDATFRDLARSADREDPPRKQGQGGERTRAEESPAEGVRRPVGAGWSEIAGRVGAWLNGVGKALQDASLEAYRKAREWWAQPRELAPEIDRNPAAAWTPPAQTYAAYEQQPQTWATRTTDRVQAQSVASILSRPKDEKVRGQASDETQPALIARNNFQFADFTGARFESVRVEENDFRHAVLTNAHFPDGLRRSNQVAREAIPSTNKRTGGGIPVREAIEPVCQAKTEAERRQDRADLIETIRQDIESREKKMREGDSGINRDTDTLRLAKEMLRQVESNADRIDLTMAYRASDPAAAEDRHIRAYSALNPLLAAAYAKGMTVDRGTASVERAQAITGEAARIHGDLSAAKAAEDRKGLVRETKDLAAESVSIRIDAQAKEAELSSEIERDGLTPWMAMDQSRFDALLAVGVLDLGKPADWRKDMEQKISDRFTALSTDAAANGKDQRSLWFEAAKQVQQDEVLRRPTRDSAVEDRSRPVDNDSREQKNEFRRAVALAR